MTDIDTSKWPKPGETWKDRGGETYGPLRLTPTGLLTAARYTWQPSGAWDWTGIANARDLVSKVEPKPEPIEVWVNEYDREGGALLGIISFKTLHQTLNAAKVGATNGLGKIHAARHHRIRIEVLETVEAQKP